MCVCIVLYVFLFIHKYSGIKASLYPRNIQCVCACVCACVIYVTTHIRYYGY